MSLTWRKKVRRYREKYETVWDNSADHEKKSLIQKKVQLMRIDRFRKSRKSSESSWKEIKIEKKKKSIIVHHLIDKFGDYDDYFHCYWPMLRIMMNVLEKLSIDDNLSCSLWPEDKKISIRGKRIHFFYLFLPFT